MAENMRCLRCGGTMRYIKREQLQLGETGWILGNLPNLLSGSLEADIFVCDQCGKIEFFTADPDFCGEETPQKRCPHCGEMHDFDYPKCPYCGYDYYADGAEGTTEGEDAGDTDDADK